MAEHDDLFEQIPLLKRNDALHKIGSRLLLSKRFMVLYVIQLILQITLVSWGLMHHYYNSSVLSVAKEPRGYIILDIVATSFFSIEVLIRSIILGKGYFSSIINVTDLIVLILSIVSACLYAWKPSLLWYDMICLIFRYCFQSYRVVTIIRHLYFRKSYVKTADDNISFSGHVGDEYEDFFFVENLIP